MGSLGLIVSVLTKLLLKNVGVEDHKANVNSNVKIAPEAEN